MYGDLIRRKEFDRVAKCTILSARNVDMDEINKRVFELLNLTEEQFYTSVESAVNCDDNGDIGKLPKYLNNLSPSSFPSYELLLMNLKSNCIVMLIRNLNINEGFCNSTRLIILEFANH